MILDLEKQRVDDSWHILSSHTHHLPLADGSEGDEIDAL